MEITDVISVLLICQHSANVYGDLPWFQHSNWQEFDQSLQQLAKSLQPFSQPSRTPVLPLQQPNFFQQNPFLQFQQPNVPQQRPSPQLQQPYRPQQQPYRSSQQSYPAPKQPTQPFYQQPLQHAQSSVCQLPSPICGDGRPAICTQNAVTAFPYYSCPNPASQFGFPLPSYGVPRMTESSMGQRLFNATGLESSAGDRSLLGYLTGPTPDNGAVAQISIDSAESAGQGASPTSTRNQAMNPPSPFAGYPLSCCLLGTLAGLQTLLLSNPPSGSLNTQPCKPGQLGCSDNYPLPQSKTQPPLSPVGYTETLPPTPYSSGTLPVPAFGPPAAQPPNVRQPGFSNLNQLSSPAGPPSWPCVGGKCGSNGDTLSFVYLQNPPGFGNPYARKEPLPTDYKPFINPFGSNSHISGTQVIPGFQGPLYSAVGSQKYQQNLPSAHPHRSQSYSTSNERKVLNPFPKFPKYRKYTSPGRSPLSEQQPIGTVPQANKYQPPFSGGFYSPVYQPKFPMKQSRNSSKIQNVENRQLDRQTQLRSLKTPGNRPLSSLGYTTIFKSQVERFPKFEGTQYLAKPMNPPQNPFARVQEDSGYQAEPTEAPGVLGSMIQGVQSFLQSGFQSDSEISPPSGLTPQQNPYRGSTGYQPFPYSQNVPHVHPSGSLSNNTQNPQPFLPSGLSLLPQLDEEPSRGQKSLDSDDKLSPLAKKISKKTSNRSRKPSNHSE